LDVGEEEEGGERRLVNLPTEPEEVLSVTVALDGCELDQAMRFV
jgi:hypothetical protein